ncbi:MAG: BglI family type II restriction endonuclease [Gammaproteobacteria bacterium]|nr:BglI family type II restriction endonuclease [Gammaproteobacteria bacterium]
MDNDIKDIDILKIEQVCQRMVVRAMRDYEVKAKDIFRNEGEDAKEVAEDVTREAMEALGVSRIDYRLYGKVDYKRAAFVFLPESEQGVALMVDSKAEKDGDTVTIQMSQTSMEVRQKRGGKSKTVPGKLEKTIKINGKSLLTVTIFVKYVYIPSNGKGLNLREIVVACVPNGLLQERYNPSSEKKSFWRAGRNAPSLGEEFRVRVNLKTLAQIDAWRVTRWSVE